VSILAAVSIIWAALIIAGLGAVGGLVNCAIAGEFALPHIDREEGGRENIEKRGHRVEPIFTRADLIGADAAQRPDIAVA